MRKGQKMPMESRLKMSLDRQGENNPMYGKTPWNKGVKGLRVSPETEFKKGQTAWNKGLHPEYVQGENHPMWRGGSSYRAVHKWIQRVMGKPDTCEGCGRSGLSGRFIHWANISGEYKREITDWKRLCAKCHKEYDRQLWVKISRQHYG